MKLMTSLIFSILYSSLVLASGSSVGPRPTASFSNDLEVQLVEKEIIFNQGEANGQIRFSHGTLVKEKWVIEQHIAPVIELDQNVIDSLDESKTKGDWAPILKNK